MIALISFKDTLFITREEAERLKLEYKECSKVGIYNNQLQEMNSDNYYYKDELEAKVDENGYTDYYKDENKISSYCIYDRPKIYLDYVKVESNGHLVDLDWFALNCRYPFFIEKCVKSEEPSVANIKSILHQIEDKVHQIDETINIFKQNSFNQKCDVHVGGGLIVTYNDLMLKEDSCTDELQGELNNGWRIIAVCVQPNQRRPDYVLGRYNPSLDVYKKDSADR